MFETLKTGIKELDLILGGGLRYPKDSAAFAFITGGPGTGKTILGLEIMTRCWRAREEGGGLYLFYSVEQGPLELQRKLEYDFGHYFGHPGEVRVRRDGLVKKVLIEIDAPRGGVNRLVLLQANPAALQVETENIRPTMDIEWIRAEIQNLSRADNVIMVGLDNVGLLLSDLKYMQKRASLLQIRHDLAEKGIQGIFIQEESDNRETRLPSPEEFSADLLLRLNFIDLQARFKARMIEVEKARHQYYYRGLHHFSIAGKDTKGQQYLGARSERGPGVHIYPSIPTQLSMIRDLSRQRRPPRGPERLAFGVTELDGAFTPGKGPLAGSSTMILAEPGGRLSCFLLHFCRAGIGGGEGTYLISTKEDEDAIRRICQADPELADSLLAGKGGSFHPSLKMRYLHPELIPPGKFTWDIIDFVEEKVEDLGLPRAEGRGRRLVFDNIYRLRERFPLLQEYEAEFLVLSLLDMLRTQGVTPLFVDLVTGLEGKGAAGEDCLNKYSSRFDNLIHLFPARREGGSLAACRVIKAVGCEFRREVIPLPSLGRCPVPPTREG